MRYQCFGKRPSDVRFCWLRWVPLEHVAAESHGNDESVSSVVWLRVPSRGFTVEEGRQACIVTCSQQALWWNWANRPKAGCRFLWPHPYTRLRMCSVTWIGSFFHSHIYRWHVQILEAVFMVITEVVMIISGHVELTSFSRQLMFSSSLFLQACNGAYGGHRANQTFMQFKGAFEYCESTRDTYFFNFDQKKDCVLFFHRGQYFLEIKMLQF